LNLASTFKNLIFNDHQNYILVYLGATSTVFDSPNCKDEQEEKNRTSNCPSYTDSNVDIRQWSWVAA
jgi:hypothetical protein